MVRLSPGKAGPEIRKSTIDQRMQPVPRIGDQGEDEPRELAEQALVAAKEHRQQDRATSRIPDHGTFHLASCDSGGTVACVGTTSIGPAGGNTVKHTFLVLIVLTISLQG